MEGTPFGRYRLIELIGRGGMGEVWRAYDTETQRVVAVKVLPVNLANDPVFTERFRREALAAASLNDPHVVPIHHFGEIDGRLYVDMRLVHGRDLQAIIANGVLDPERAVNIISQVASALRSAHRIGLVHRDVKPSNILVTEDDFAYLIDFGIARTEGEASMTGTGNVIGTWAYMPPERVTSGQTDPRGDTYALGCVLHECLTGSHPFPGDSLQQQIGGHLSKPPPRPSVMRRGLPREIDDVIAKAMAKNPEDRYATVTEMAAAAKDAISGTGTRKAPAVRSDPIKRPPPQRIPPGRPKNAQNVLPPGSARRPPTDPNQYPPTTRRRHPSDPSQYPPAAPSPRRPPSDPNPYLPPGAPPRRSSSDPNQYPPPGPSPRRPPSDPNQYVPQAERRPATDPNQYAPPTVRRPPSDPNQFAPPTVRRPASDPSHFTPLGSQSSSEPTMFRPSGDDPYSDPTLYRPPEDQPTPVPWPEPDGVPEDASPATPPAKDGRRAWLMVVGAAALVTVVGIVIAFVLTSGGGDSATPAASPTTTTQVNQNAATFTGLYAADFGPKLSLSGKEVPDSDPPSKETWVVRSSCSHEGCIATASRKGGGYNHTPNLTFDDVRGRWIAIVLEGGTCNNKSIEKWNYVWLQPRADGRLEGEWITDSLDCYSKRKVTFTRTGDANAASLGDPNDQPPRVVSPAQGLHGNYHLLTTYTGPSAPRPQEADYTVDTICVRTGERCLSRFVRSGGEGTQLLLFANNVWTRDDEYDAPCPAGGTSHVKITGTFPLPEPHVDPIAELKGSGFKDESGSSCKGGDYQMTFTRTGG
ncbi:serine/threonine protein kinase [Mycobacterium intermedium]|uniref:non-specific serine/threonine protein kinase n=1 Tax=Mycobacterium intermedium TaxID=28445 RepID=A0A1E3S9W1_MYCIE|nr:protein kinase [Mycobacterium intermedium]ODQ98422.1 hypothetical protein BHQ20_22235 [Mycobacterium intermedium]OPE47692.1 serine/threonine protein kinase [Mycobacterium intermedium]ORB01491.1 serine/threonine protein kinase [Mycobacterium intermedium]